MGRLARHHILSLADYFAVERGSSVKHEFSDGQVLAMAGGSPRHNAISAQVVFALVGGLRGRPCRAYSSDQRLSTGDGLYTYADASVICGDVLLGPEQTATNPSLVVEVLSDSTREYDRGEKLERYRSIASLRHVLLVEQLRVDVEHWYRGADGWERRVYTHLADPIGLPEASLTLTVSDLYGDLDGLPPA